MDAGDAIDDVLAVTSFLEILDPLAAARLAFYDGDAVVSADAMWATLVAPSHIQRHNNMKNSTSASTSGGDLTDSSSSESGRGTGRKRVVDADADGREQRQPRGKARKSTYLVRKVRFAFCAAAAAARVERLTLTSLDAMRRKSATSCSWRSRRSRCG